MKKIPKKILTMPETTESGNPVVSPCIVCYTEKEKKTFWFSSLGQIFQFGTINFRRTFKNYFGQFVWIEVPILSLSSFLNNWTN